jgi:hypothetical protein
LFQRQPKHQSLLLQLVQQLQLLNHPVLELTTLVTMQLEVLVQLELLPQRVCFTCVVERLQQLKLLNHSLTTQT